VKTLDQYRIALERMETAVEYRVEVAALRFVGEVVAAMRFGGIKQASLAARLGTSEPYVSKVLRGDTNFTLGTMVRIADALGKELHLHLAEPGAFVRWLDVLKGTGSNLTDVSPAAQVTFSHMQQAGGADVADPIAA